MVARQIKSDDSIVNSFRCDIVVAAMDDPFLQERAYVVLYRICVTFQRLFPWGVTSSLPPLKFGEESVYSRKAQSRMANFADVGHYIIWKPTNTWLLVLYRWSAFRISGWLLTLLAISLGTMPKTRNMHRRVQWLAAAHSVIHTSPISPFQPRHKISLCTPAQDLSPSPSTNDGTKA